jgi:hypothetical protein
MNRDQLRRDLRGAGGAILAVALVLANGAPGAAEGSRRVIDEGQGTEGAPSLEASGDFDGDGRADRVTVSVDTGAIRVAYGEMNGTLSAPVQVATAHDPARLQTADLNGDLQDDLEVYSTRGALHVLLGRAAPAFDVIGPLGEAPSSDGAPADPGLDTHPSCLAPPFDPRPHGFWNFTIDLGGLEFRDGALLSWATDCEIAVQGFNVVRLLFRGSTVERIQLNGAPIACQGCDDGIGYGYTFLVPRHRSIHNLFIEAVFIDGRAKYLGPPAVSTRPYLYP